jgi:hypothetical protein
MSLGDMRWLRGPKSVQRFLVKAGSAASINAGEPVIQNTGSDVEYVTVPGADVTTSVTFVGIATSTSTDTASVDGYVYVTVPSASTVFRADALTPGSLAAAVRLTKCTMDYDSNGKYTVDESTTTNGFCQIVDYNSTEGTVDFLVDMSEFLNN